MYSHGFAVCCILLSKEDMKKKKPKIKCHSAYIDVLRKFWAPIRGQIIFLRRIYPLPVKLRKQSDMITVYPGNVAIDFWISLGPGRLPAPNRRDMNKKHVLARLLFFMNISRCWKVYITGYFFCGTWLHKYSWSTGEYRSAVESGIEYMAAYKIWMIWCYL